MRQKILFCAPPNGPIEESISVQIGGSACVLPDPSVSLSVTAAQGADAPGSRILLRPDPLDDLRLASVLRPWAAQGLQAPGRQRPSRSTALEPRRHPGIRSGRGSRSPLAPCPATGFTAMGDGSCSMQMDGDARATVAPEDPVGGIMRVILVKWIMACF